MPNPIALKYLGAAAVTIALGVVAALWPGWSAGVISQAGVRGINLVAELLALALMLAMISLAWNDDRTRHVRMAGLVLFGWTVVATLDTLHLLNHPGMPGGGVSKSEALGLYYQLTARSAEALYLLALALAAGLAGRHRRWFAVALVCAALIAVVGMRSPALLAWLYHDGQGATPPARAWQYLIAAVNAACVLLFYRRWRSTRMTISLQMGVTCVLLAIGALLHVGNLGRLDGADLAAHVFRTLAYFTMYAVVHAIVVANPNARLERSRQTIARQNREMTETLNDLPVEIVLLDRAFRYRYANPAHAARIGRTLEELVGTPWLAGASTAQQERARGHLQAALQGRHARFDLREEQNGIVLQSLNATAAPRMGRDGRPDGVLLTLIDDTEAENTRLMTALSLHEAADLKAALDAHALVTVGNAQGIITQVNDKFCEVSQYQRGELIGQSYALLRSGMHSADSLAAASATTHAGQVWTGEVCNRAKDGSLFWTQTTIVPFTSGDGAPTQFITLRTDITERKNAEQQARQMALYDELTGLPNRRLIADHIQQACNASARSGRFNAVMLLDLDNFKEINDTQGHDQGDELLRRVAQRLRGKLRSGDVVARLGGDEFVILVLGLSTNAARAGEEGLTIAEKVRATLDHAFNLNNRLMHTSASVGVSVFQGSMTSQEDILKHADMALYRAKARGRNQVSLFDPGLQTEVEHRASLMADLRIALEQDQMRLHYQVIVDDARRPQGYEALLRWQHPTRGNVPPLSFIDKAEQSGLILPIGTWVLQTACEQLARWASEPAMANQTLAVNISARQFRDPGFVGVVESALKQTGANARLLYLELTESMFHAEMEQSIAKMQQLCALGVRFALDDFGTGYSSLGYLRRMPLDIIKIDKSFVDDILTDPNDAAIAQTILGLARTLELRVVAEGIEQAEQFEWLKERGCDAFQGYFFGLPRPADQLDA